MKDRYIELAKKLKALADQGIGGEKVNASIQLAKLMEKHGLTEEDINGIEVKLHWFKIAMKEQKFFWQIVSNVCGTLSSTYENRKSKLLKGVKCTAAEAVEIEAKHRFYYNAYSKEMKIFYSAFIQANALYKKIDNDKDDNKPIQELTEEQMRVLAMARGIQKQSFHKQLDK